MQNSLNNTQHISTYLLIVAAIMASGMTILVQYNYVIILMILAFFPLLVLCYVKPEYGLYLSIISITFSHWKLEFGPTALSPPNFVLIVLFLVLLLKNEVRIKYIDRNMKFVYIVLIITYIADLLVCILSPSLKESFVFILFPKTRTLLLFLLPILIVDDMNKLRKAILALTITVIIVTIVTITLAAKPSLSSSKFLVLVGRISPARSIGGYLLPFSRTSAFLKFGQYGTLSYPIIVISFSSLFIKNHLLRNRFFAFIILFSLLAGLTATQTRHIYLAIIGALFVSIILSNKKKYLPVILNNIVFLSAIVLMVFFAKGVLSQILETMYMIDYGNVIQRFDQMQFGIEKFRRNPIWGTGFITFQDELFGYVLHNFYIYKLASGGLISFIPWITFIISILFLSYKSIIESENITINIAIIGLLSGTIGSLISAFFLKSDVSWLALGLMCAIYNLQKSTQNLK